LRDSAVYARLKTPLGFLLTFVAVAAAMVLFRSSNAHAAKEILEGMAGLNGVGLPAAVFERLGSVTQGLQSLTSVSQELSAKELLLAIAWVLGLLTIALALPNTLQILGKFEPALDMRAASGSKKDACVVEWSPSLPWAIAISSIAVLAIVRLGGPSEFLYWQF
jgi:hypothetical protein